MSKPDTTARVLARIAHASASDVHTVASALLPPFKRIETSTISAAANKLIDANDTALSTYAPLNSFPAYATEYKAALSSYSDACTKLAHVCLLYDIVCTALHAAEAAKESASDVASLAFDLARMFHE